MCETQLRSVRSTDIECDRSIVINSVTDIQIPGCDKVLAHRGRVAVHDDLAEVRIGIEESVRPTRRGGSKKYDGYSPSDLPF